MNLPVTTESLLTRLPFANDLESVFDLKAFLQTPEGASKFESYRNAYKIFALLKKWTPFAFVAFIIIALATKFLMNNFGTVIWCSIGTYVAYSGFKANYKIKEKSYLNKRWAYAVKLAKQVGSVLGGYYYIFPDTQILFYNNHLCVYADANEGGLTGYNKGSIKKVNLDHVHLGSTTVSKSNTTGITFNSGSINHNTLDYRGRATNFSSTKTTAQTKVHYEWKLDILTSFIEEPHITLVFPDNQEGEDSAKKVYAILS